MATPPDSPMEEVVFELEPSRVPKPIPVALEDLVRQTKFSRQEIRVMYRGFKTVSFCILLFPSLDIMFVVVSQNIIFRNVFRDHNFYNSLLYARCLTIFEEILEIRHTSCD